MPPDLLQMLLRRPPLRQHKSSIFPVHQLRGFPLPLSANRRTHALAVLSLGKDVMEHRGFPIRPEGRRDIQTACGVLAPSVVVPAGMVIITHQTGKGSCMAAMGEIVAVIRTYFHSMHFQDATFKPSAASAVIPSQSPLARKPSGRKSRPSLDVLTICATKETACGSIAAAHAII